MTTSERNEMPAETLTTVQVDPADDTRRAIGRKAHLVLVAGQVVFRGWDRAEALTWASGFEAGQKAADEEGAAWLEDDRYDGPQPPERPDWLIARQNYLDGPLGKPGSWK